MKKIHIILLVFIAGAIALLISLLNTGSTYDTIAEAKAKPGKFVHVAVRRDTTMTVEYDQLKDPNYLSFHAVAVDTSKETMKVVYRGGPIENLMISERLILKGKLQREHEATAKQFSWALSRKNYRNFFCHKPVSNKF